MKIRLLISRAGPRGVYAVGDEIDVSATEAQRLIVAGKAVLADAAPAVERAVPSDEPRVERRRSRKRR